MEPREQTSNMEELDYTQEDVESRPEMSHDDDAEKSFLLREDYEHPRRSASPRRSHIVLALITIFNLILFLASIGILSISKTKSISDQDLWRATSYYCTSHLRFPITPFTPLTLRHSTRLRPLHHPQTNPHRQRHPLGHPPTLNLARQRPSCRLRMGLYRQQRPTHHHIRRPSTLTRQKSTHRCKSSGRRPGLIYGWRRRLPPTSLPRQTETRNRRGNDARERDIAQGAYLALC